VSAVARRLPLFLLAVAVFVAAAPAVAEAKFARVASFPVTFQVQNTDRSNLVCGTDGAAYQIKGYLTGPKTLLRASKAKKRSVTLYLHGLGFGGWFWHVGDLPGVTAPRKLDYAVGEAEAGHVSVTIDRLGYGASGHPNGYQSCLGGQADIAHQIVQQLRSGSYSVTGRAAVRFKKVAIAGHSIGAEIAMIEAYSFKDVKALVVASFSFQNLPRAQVALGPTRDTCLAGGEPAGPGAPTGYAYFGQPTEADFAAIMFRTTPPAFVLPLRNRDPCGDINTIIPALLQQQSQLPSVKVPVLVICGTKDALYAPLGCQGQAERFKGNRHVDVQSVRNAPHAITLDKGATTFRGKVSRWLKKRGF
jgi:pimeloyl-ACP methyl ester carboxylesterase